MKICPSCSTPKPLEDFVATKKGQNVHRRCSACRAAIRAAYSAAKSRKPGERERIRRYDRSYYGLHGHRGPKQAAQKAWLVEQKAKPCMDCGGQFPPEAMDFDHREGEQKAFEISTAMATTMSREAIAVEMSKCDLVCANCHRVRTKRRGDARRAVRRALVLGAAGGA
jgi:hypothetical protein